MTETEILDRLNELSKQNKALADKIEEITEGNELERSFVHDEPKKRSQMLSIDPTITDKYGDSIEVVTKSRVSDFAESYRIAAMYIDRIHRTMVGNRFGKHSTKIPVFNSDGTENKLDMDWFSGQDVKIVETNGKAYYYARLDVLEAFITKILLLRIPTNSGAARQEEIQHIGAERAGQKWTGENTPLSPMKPINYNPEQPRPRTTMKNVGELVYE